MKKFALLVAVTCIGLSACKQAPVPPVDTSGSTSSVTTSEVSDIVEGHTSASENTQPADATEAQIISIEARCEEEKKEYVAHCATDLPQEEKSYCLITPAEQVYRGCVASGILSEMLGEDVPDETTDEYEEPTTDDSMNQ